MRGARCGLVVCLLAGLAHATDIHFEEAQTWPYLGDVAANPFAIGDVDGDGDLDLVALEDFALDGTYLYLNDGTGAFGGAITIDTSMSGPNRAPCLVDLDRDGDLDLVVGGYGERARFMNDGTGVFGPKISIQTGSFLFGRYICADVTGDGAPDIIDAVQQADKVVYYPNNGDGSFVFGVETAIATLVEDPVGVAAGDLDGDGDLDIVSSIETDRTLLFHEMDGSGGVVGTTQIYSDVFIPGAVVTGDLDRDGDVDVAAIVGVSARWYENTAGDGSAWTEHTIGNTSPIAPQIEILDVDRDGDLDVVTPRGTASEASWWENTAGDASSWTLRTITDTQNRPLGIELPDLDGDGDRDAVVGSIFDDRIVRYENREIHRNALFTAPAGIGGFGGSSRVTLADLDGDGDLDPVVPSESNDEIVWLENDGGPFTSWTVHQVGAVTFPEAVTVVDLDGDGDLDVVSETQVGIPWFESDGASPPAFTARTIPASCCGGRDVVHGDVDRDGDVDLVVSRDFGIRWYENTGGSPPAFTEHTIPDVADNIRDSHLVDLDRDGDLDLLTAQINGSTLTWYENDGDTPPGWTTRTIMTSGGVLRCSPADVDGDGDLDIAVAGLTDGALYLQTNLGGSPPVWAQSTIASLTLARGVVAADFDVDGDNDIVVSRSGGAQLLYENDGAVPPQWTAREMPSALTRSEWVVGDLDRDGDPDLLGINSGLLSEFFNVGGQYGVTNADAGNGAAPEGEVVPFLATTISLNGRPGDAVGEMESLVVSFETVGGVPLTTGQLASFVDFLGVYRDDGSGAFEADRDVEVVSGVVPDLVGGVQTISFTGSSPNALLAAPATYFVTGVIGATAATTGPGAIRITHLSGDSLIEQADTTIPLSPQPLSDFESQAIFSIPGFSVDSTADLGDAVPGDGICDAGGGVCTLRAAVQEANALAGADYVVLGAGTYALTLSGTDDVAAVGDLDVTDDLTVVGLGPSETVLDVNGLDGGFAVLAAALELSGVRIVNAANPGNGGAIYSSLGVVSVDGCDLGDNAAAAGSAIHGDGASVSIANSVIRQNMVTASDRAAVDVSGGSLSMTNVTLSGNTGTTNAAAIRVGATGAVAAVASFLTVTGGDVGVHVTAGSTLDLSNSIVSGNTTDTVGSVDEPGPNLIGGSPLLLPLGDHGGQTLTHALDAASPAIDAGSCGSVGRDQRDVLRPIDDPATANADDGCDLGAVEAQLGQIAPPLEVPIRWCGLRGAPSIEDPSLVGAVTTDEVMRRRHERASEEIYLPKAGVLLRSAGNFEVASFPLLEDPDCTETSPGVFDCARGVRGEVFIDPAVGDFEEFQSLISACRVAWQEIAPEIEGVTAVHIDRFIAADGTPLEILGIGGRVSEGAVAGQASGARLMVTDHLYRLDVPGNPSPPSPPDLIDRLLGHEMGHAFSLEHGDGVDNDNDGLLDNDDDAAEGLPRFDGPNLMQYRNGSELTELQVSRIRTHLDETAPELDLQPLVDSRNHAEEIDEERLRILQFGYDGLTELSISQILQFVEDSVLDFEKLRVLQFEKLRILQFERLRVLQFEKLRVLQFGMDFRDAMPASRTAIFGALASVPWPAAIRPTSRYYFYLDLDRDDATGGYPLESANPGNPPESFPGGGNLTAEGNLAEEAGVDLIVEVVLESACPAATCSSSATVNAYDYNDTTEIYELVFSEPDADISAHGIGLYVDNGGDFVELDDIPYGMTIEPRIPNAVLYAAGWGTRTSPLGDPIPDRVRMEMVTTVECVGNVLNDSPASSDVDCQCAACADCPDYPGCVGTAGTPRTLTGTTITAQSVAGELTFEPARLPQCVTAPQLAAEGSALTVHVTGLPTDVVGTVEAVVGATILTTAPSAAIAPDGSISLSTALPAGATGQVVVAVGLQGLAPRASCIVTVSPTIDCPDNDGDGTCDGADPDDDNDQVPDGADDQPSNRLACRDTDADGCDDCASGEDNPLADGPDYDLDGLCDTGDPDDDNDGVPDSSDLDPFNPNGCGDSDGDRCDDCILTAMPTPENDGPDLDADGLCDFGDPDDDNDGTADPADCAPTDGTLAQAPVAENVVIEFTSGVRVEWNRDRFGSATTSDLLRGAGAGLPVGAGVETCLEDSTSATFRDDATVPSPGEWLWYLVRSSNACGADGYGDDSAGTERVSAACPGA